MRYLLLALAVACGGPDESTTYAVSGPPAVSRAPAPPPQPVSDPTVTPPAPAFTVADCTPLCPGAASVQFAAGGTFGGSCGSATVQPSCSCSCAVTPFIIGFNVGDPAARASASASWVANCR